MPTPVRELSREGPLGGGVITATKGTRQHTRSVPTDDRPDYLVSQPYRLAIDTETDGLNWYDGKRPFIATVSDYDRDFLFKMDDPVQVAALRDAILKADEWIFHNAAFDIHHLVTVGVVSMDEVFSDSRIVHDTDLLARCVLGADNGPFGLKHLATELVDPAAATAEDAVLELMVSMGLIKKVDQKKKPDGAYYKVWLSYPDPLELYALMDTRYTYDLFHILMDRATEQDLQVYDLERRAMPVVIKMEHRGVRLDQPVVERLSTEYTAEVATQQAFLANAADNPDFNPDSNQQIADLLLSKGVPLTATTDTGDLRVDKWALERFKGHPVVDMVLAERTNSKFLSTYIGPMVGRDTVHANVWQIGARTGRMSYSNPNLQNLPVRGGSELRSMFVPREGHAFVVCDYSSIELRLLAYYMNDERLWGIIQDGDPFLWLGEQIYGTPDQDKWPVKRGPLKNGFYALTYGAGGPKLAQTIGGGMTDDEGRALAKNIKGTLGKPYYALNRRIKQQVRNAGYVRTLEKRTQYCEPGKDYLALNKLIQGSAADIMKRGLIYVAEALVPIGGYPLLVVHDEVLAEVPLGQEHRGLEIVQTGMAAATNAFPLKVDGKVCYNNYGEGK